ncbi:hypothetical protein DSECCO2_445860 [anaerobic digester metagenome]
MDIQSCQHADEGREKADGPRAGYECILRFPERTLADLPHHLPGFRDDRRRLKEDAEDPEIGVYFHRVLGFDPPPLGHEPVDLLDAAFSVEAVGAHIPLPDRTVRAGDRVGAPDDSHHQIPGFQPRPRSGIDDAAERLVPQNEPRFARRRPTVFSRYDLGIGPADADGDRFHEHRAVPHIRFGDVLQPCGPWFFRFNSNRFHLFTSGPLSRVQEGKAPGIEASPDTAVLPPGYPACPITRPGAHGTGSRPRSAPETALSSPARV